jgi:hypothetical protein
MGCSCSPTSLTADTCNAARAGGESKLRWIYLNTSRTRRGTQGDTAAFTHKTALCYSDVLYNISSGRFLLNVTVNGRNTFIACLVEQIELLILHETSIYCDARLEKREKYAASFSFFRSVSFVSRIDLNLKH